MSADLNKLIGPKRQNGGKRPGAGRKPGVKTQATITKEEAREVVRKLIMQHMAPMVEAQVANALGIKYLVARNKVSGKFVKLTEEAAKTLLESEDAESSEVIEVWEKDPSVQAFTDLANRALDKPKEQEQALDIQGALEIRWKPVT